MAEENAAAETAAAQDAQGVQQEQPATDWEAKYKGAMEHARLWEDRAKANVEKANAYDEIAAQAEKSAADAAVGNALEANADSTERNYGKKSAMPCNVVEHHTSHIPFDLG